MAHQVGRTRLSPSSSASSSIIPVDGLSESTSTPESKSSSATRLTSVSSNSSEKVENSRSPNGSSARIISTRSARSAMRDESQRPSTSQPIETRPKEVPKTRRSLGVPAEKESVRQTSSSSTAPLLGPTSQVARSAQIPKNSIRDYFLPATDRPAKHQLSGETLVAAADTSGQPSPKKRLLDDGVKALHMGWNVEKLAIPLEMATDSDVHRDKRRSTRTRISTVAGTVAATASSLGKKGREAIESGKEKLQELSKGSALRKRKPEMTDAVELEQTISKRTKLSATSTSKTFTATEERLIRKPAMSKKTWLSKGLYVGQTREFDGTAAGAKNKKRKAPEEDVAPYKENKMLPMPMYGGEALLKRGRDFRLPFDVFSPLPPGQPRPNEWWKKQANRFIGEAATEWKKTKPLDPSRCMCRQEDGCGEDCQNRYMLYECDEDNCSIGAEHCTNRPFAELKVRSKSEKKYAIGVEVMKTVEKGFGVRSCRTFEPNQVIVEYTGEIITQDECERRMVEEYKDRECYYLMTFDQNMIIDATRGSIARFVNHSCAPNCRMVKWTVAGKPRMALFAGDDGIMTGQELTYDYNFDPFSQKNVQTCRCGAVRCRGVLGPRLSKDKEAKLMETLSKKGSAVVIGAKRKLQEVLGNTDAPHKKAEPVQKKKKPQGSGIWGGNWEWVKK